MFNITIKYLVRLLTDFVIITLLLGLSLNMSNIWGPVTKRGFFCGDESLMYPLRRNTISYPILYTIGLGIPVLAIVVGGLIESLVLNSRPTKNGLRLLLMIHDTLLPFLFGFAAERLLKEIGKFALGRLRPYFFAVCQPVLWDGTTCESAENYGLYIENYDCVGGVVGGGAVIDADGMLHRDKAMRSSFPSGHASLAFYGITFTVYYLQRFSVSLRRYRASFGLFVPLLQLLCVLLAWFVAISRVLDYKHHWSDVLAGGLLGLSVAIAVAYHVHGHIKGGGTFLEAVVLPKRSPTLSGPPGGATSIASMASTHLTDITRSGEDLNVTGVHVVS